MYITSTEKQVRVWCCMLNCSIKADMYITFVFFTSGCVRGYVCQVVIYITCIDNPSGPDWWMTHKNIDVFKVFSMMQNSAVVFLPSKLLKLCQLINICSKMIFLPKG